MPLPDSPRLPTVLRHSYDVSEVRIRRPSGDRVDSVMVWRSSWIVSRDVATPAELRRIIAARAYPDYLILVGAFASDAAALSAISADSALLKKADLAR